MINGLYLDEGFVDVHAVVVNPKISGQLTIATRYGVFRSDDRGANWHDLKAPLLRPIGSYCRVLRYAPNDPNTLYLGAANDFDGDRGALGLDVHRRHAHGGVAQLHRHELSGNAEHGPDHQWLHIHQQQHGLHLPQHQHHRYAERGDQR